MLEELESTISTILISPSPACFFFFFFFSGKLHPETLQMVSISSEGILLPIHTSIAIQS